MGWMTAKGAATRHAILSAAIARFGREGYRATSVADIARDATVGPSVPYRYFGDKEALFLAAVDEDAGAVIRHGLAGVFESPDPLDWRPAMLLALVDAVEQHPLARRLLAGLEPEVTARVLEMPALAELREACSERLSADQRGGSVRPDIDPLATANGIVAVTMSLLMSVVQLGPGVVGRYADDVALLFAAALKDPSTLDARSPQNRASPGS